MKSRFYKVQENKKMMNIKKYRATTTREALEQVKLDLGEEAYVLETKQVRTGGFLGFKTTPQIEISAAAAPSIAANAPVKSHVKPVASAAPKSMLNLRDETPARPQFLDVKKETATKNLTETLNSRAALNDYFETSLPVAVSHSIATTAPARSKINRRQNIEAVEISTEAPRFVSPKKTPTSQNTNEKDSSTMTTLPAAENAASVTNREFEMIRAELREMKFSLGAFASQRNTQMAHDEIHLAEFGEVFDAPFLDSYLELKATGLSAELARQYITDVIPQFKQGLIIPKQLTQYALTQGLKSGVKFLKNPLEGDTPAIMALIGATGVGKTTTVAKLAARVALYERRRVELVTLDTYRIAAVEQLKTYAEIIGAGCQVVRSTFELDAVLRRLPTDTTVLIDTTGRNPHDLSDQFELSDYLRQRKEIRKCLAVQATTNPQDCIAAIKKFEMYGADCLVLTKLDETTRPGATVEIAAESGLPLTYLCAGQRVPEDWQIASPENYAAQIMRRKV